MKLFDSDRRFASGFTLIEVVVAMTIVGLGVVTLLEIFSLGLRLGAKSTIRTEIISSGRQVMDGFLARGDAAEGAEEGSFDPRSRWKLRVQPVRQTSDQLTLSSDWELREVALEIIVTDTGRESRAELKTLRLVKKENR